VLAAGVSLFIGAWLLLPYSPGHTAAEAPSMIAYDFTVAVAVACIMGSLVLADRPTPVGRLLSTRPVVGLGTVSYGVFLWHSPILHAFGLSGGKAILFANLVLAIAVSLVVAAISWFILERPCLRFVRRPPEPPLHVAVESA
jgi:peptidoglycan/LPS O-acetylase OafA/YrhL